MLIIGSLTMSTLQRVMIEIWSFFLEFRDGVQMFSIIQESWISMITLQIWKMTRKLDINRFLPK